MRKILLTILILLLASNCYAATLWVNPAGTGTDDSAKATTGLTTIAAGIAAMSASDTLIIADGTYDAVISNPLSGSAGNYTIIKAENDGGAILESTTAQRMLYLSSKSYVQIEGLKFSNNAVNATSEVVFIDASSNHNKFLRCAFVKNPNTTSNNVTNVICSGTYNLFEDCWAWGGGRYKFQIYGGDNQSSGSYNIFRRCVARHDREYSGVIPQAAFISYQGANNIFQNCLVLNSDQIAYYDGMWTGPFFLEKGQKGGSAIINGCIALGFNGTFIFDSPTGDDSNSLYTAGDLTILNSFGFTGTQGFKGSYWVRSVARDTMLVQNCLIGDIDGDIAISETGNGAGFSGGIDSANNYAQALNSVFVNITANTRSDGYALYNVRGANDYNCFYGNTINYGASSTQGAHDITGTNPLTASILYPTRVEDSSTLDGAGASGADIGPTILKKIGTSGTLYGETGYNTTTAEDLWPWPYEDRIKTDMASYPSNWPSGDLPDPVRGFCTNTANPRTDTGVVTLTSYIWEYLGNEIPDTIYNLAATPDTTAPADVSNLSSATGSSAGEVDITFTSPGDDNVTGTATSYDIRYSTSTITEANWNQAVQLNYHLQSDSPCKGTGADLSASFTTDFAGRPRSGWSMGALE